MSFQVKNVSNLGFVQTFIYHTFIVIYLTHLTVTKKISMGVLLRTILIISDYNHNLFFLSVFYASTSDGTFDVINKVDTKATRRWWHICPCINEWLNHSFTWFVYNSLFIYEPHLRYWLYMKLITFILAGEK